MHTQGPQVSRPSPQFIKTCYGLFWELGEGSTQGQVPLFLGTLLLWPLQSDQHWQLLSPRRRVLVPLSSQIVGALLPPHGCAVLVNPLQGLCWAHRNFPTQRQTKPPVHSIGWH